MPALSRLLVGSSSNKRSGFLNKRRSQQKPRLLSAGKDLIILSCNFFVPFQINHFQNFVYSRVNIVNLGAEKHFSKKFSDGQLHLVSRDYLLGSGDGNAVISIYLARFRLQTAYYELENSALASAVLAHQSNLHPFAQGKSASFKMG